jgi:hypothetical protein
MIGPSTLIGLWTGRLGMTTVVVLTVLAGRRITSGLGFLPRLIVLVLMVIVVLIVVSRLMKEIQLRRAQSAYDERDYAPPPPPPPPASARAGRRRF